MGKENHKNVCIVIIHANLVQLHLKMFAHLVNKYLIVI